MPYGDQRYPGAFFAPQARSVTSKGGEYMGSCKGSWGDFTPAASAVAPQQLAHSPFFPTWEARGMCGFCSSGWGNFAPAAVERAHSCQLFPQLGSTCLLPPLSRQKAPIPGAISHCRPDPALMIISLALILLFYAHLTKSPIEHGWTYL